MARSAICLVLIALLFQVWALPINNTESDIQKQPKMLPKRVQELEDKVAENQKVIAEMSQVLVKLQTEVAYEVRLTSDTSYSESEVFNFDDVMYNSGEGYNKSSGIFTAPVTGIYLLWAHIMQNVVNYMAINIRSDKEVLLQGHTSAGSGLHGVASVSGVAYLTRNETVWVTTYSNGGRPLRGGFSSFGGTLLKAH